MLQGKGLLSPLQKAFLSFFAQIPDQDRFYLTGGTALAEFYFGHRLSFDLDLFTAQPELIAPVSYQIERRARAQGLPARVVRRFASYVEFLVGDEATGLKVDLALDSPYRFEPPVETEVGVRVNDFVDLKVDKLLAYYGRAEPRDAVDLYFILEAETLGPLMELAARKDSGFDAYWMAVALNRAADFPDEMDRWPVRMLVPCDPPKIKRMFQELALVLMDNLTGG